MENPEPIAFLILFLLLLIVFNGLMTRDIYNWVPLLKKQIGLYLLVWLVPVAGFFLANKLGNLSWFKREKSGGSQSAISGGFMEADAVLNPGTKHQIEMVEKSRSETHQEHQVRDGQGDVNDSKKSD